MTNPSALNGASVLSGDGGERGGLQAKMEVGGDEETPGVELSERALFCSVWTILKRVFPL